MPINSAKTTNDFAGYIKPHEAEAIFNEAAKLSVSQQLIRKVPLAASGEAVPVITQKPTANWTPEAAEKHMTEMALGIKLMTPKKLTAICVVSAEVARANPANYASLLRKELAEAFALAFDRAVIYGKDGTGESTGPFEDYFAKTNKTAKLKTTGGSLYKTLTAGMRLLVQDKKKVTGFLFDNSMEIDFLDEADSTNRPLFAPDQAVDAPGVVNAGRLLGRRAVFGEIAQNYTSQPLGFIGDFTKAAWGTVGGIKFDTSTETTVPIGGKQVSLWTHNLIAIRAEAEYGFAVADPNAFVSVMPENTAG